MTPKGFHKSILDRFHPLIREWFAGRFSRTTDIQEKAWPCIAQGEHLLITAPTGSGKTLTAFLWAIHQLVTGAWARGTTRVLYVSPLKALNNDIQQNLILPLAEIEKMFQGAGQVFPEIRVLTRSGDTPQKDRRKMSLHPPEILITTPESLNLMLSSLSGRQMLQGLCSVILDEIHAVAGSKRGVHLMTGVERLVSLSGEFQRIALSATLRERDPVARFVGGFSLKGTPHIPEYIPRPLTRIHSSIQKAYQIQVCFVEKEQEQDPETTTVWDLLAQKFKHRIEQNQSTLFFTNGRRLCEKLTFKVNTLFGHPLVYAHHGSLSRELRWEVEQKLKNGELKAIIATNSLEMGIDIGVLDEVVLVQSPPTISAAVQRMGRAGHQVGSVSCGRIFPAHTQDLIGAAVLARAIDQGDIESLALVHCPLDVLAQVLVSMIGQEPWDLDRLYAAVRTSYSFHCLSRDQFDLVLNMLAGRYAETRIRELTPRVSIDRLDNTVEIKKGALLSLYMSGGTIPDRGYFKLRHAETRACIGELDEEYVWEARIGQVATLGTQNWRIVRITHNDVFALPAGNRKMEAPFWIGETLNRDFHFSHRMGLFLERANGFLGVQKAQKTFARELAQAYHLDETAVQALMAFLTRQKERTQTDLPHRHHLVLEYVHSGPGGSPGTMLVIHTLWGGRVNRPYALALEAAWANKFKELPEIFPGNDAVIVQLPHDLDPSEILGLVTPQNLDLLVRQRLESSGFFSARFRECAGRALLVTRNRINQRMPLWMTRLRSQKLMENVLAYEDFPILLETWRTCLQDEFDMPALYQVLGELASGVISWSRVVTSRPSPFAASLAWSQIHQYMYQEDQPASGASSLGSNLIADLIFAPHLRPTVPEQVVKEFETKRHRLAKGYAPDSTREVLDWVKERVAIPLAEWCALGAAVDPESGPRESRAKALQGKLVLMTPPEAREPLVISLEQAAWICPAWYGLENFIQFRDLDQKKLPLDTLAWIAKKIPQNFKKGQDKKLDQEPDQAETGLALLGQWLGFYGPRSVLFVQTTLGLDPHRLQAFLTDLAEARSLVTGLLVKNGNPQDICDARNFETLVRMARNRAVPRFDPLDLAFLPLFLAQVQGLTQPGRDVEALFHSLEQLGCLPLPAGLWETEILPARIRPYHPSFLDTLMQEGDLMWLGLGKEKIGFCFDTDLDFFKAPRESERSGDKRSLEAIFHPPGVRHDFFSLKTLTGRDTPELVPLIWEAVWKGRLSNDTFLALRKGIETRFSPAAPSEHPDRSLSRFSRRRRPGRSGFSLWQGTLPLAGRWYQPIHPRPLPDLMEKEELNKERARLLLDRYGILFRELVQKELPGFQWPGIFKSLYLMELSGEILAGYFFREIPGPQFISQKAFHLLQAGLAKEAIFWMNAMDPASPCGLGLGQSSLPRRVPGNHLVFKGETLVLVSQRRGRALTLHVLPRDPDLPRYLGVLSHLLNRETAPMTCITVETINDQDAAQSPYADDLKTLFEVVTEFKHLVLYRQLTGPALPEEPG